MMYQQIQSRPTAFIWWTVPKTNIIELVNGGFALSSVLSVLPMTRNVVDDFPPSAAFSLQICNVNQPIPLNRSIIETIPPNATYSLQTVIQIVPLTRTITDDFPPNVNYSLQSVVQLTPVNQSFTDTHNAGYALQSVSA